MSCDVGEVTERLENEQSILIHGAINYHVMENLGPEYGK